ncbi:MAG: hypothetical protein NVSMB51_15130 [Solirubrobacteraceae bacterium]
MPVNERRAGGRSPLQPDTALTSCAAAQAWNMRAHDFFDHSSSDGRDPVLRILTSGFVPTGDAYAAQARI